MNKENYQSIWTHLMATPFRLDYVDAGGIRTRYVNAGPKDAPKLIMLHGMGGSWENLFANLSEHAKYFDVYALDMIGHGFTDKPDRLMTTAEYVNHVKDFMDAMRIDKASFIGLSLGSWVTTKIAARHPERVEKVSMLSAWGRLVAKPDVNSPFFREGNKNRLAAAIDPTWERMEKIFEGLIAKPEQRLPDLLGLRQKIYSQPSMGKTMENIFNGLDASWTEGYVTDEEARSIKAPYAIYATVNHKDIFLDCAYDYAKLIPNNRVVELQEAAHWPQWESAEEFNRINIEFLRG